MWLPGRRSRLSHPDLEQLAHRIAERFAERVRDLLEEFFGARQREEE